MNPKELVEQRDDGWYWWNEVLSECFGPYETEAQAIKDRQYYLGLLNDKEKAENDFRMFLGKLRRTIAATTMEEAQS